MQWVIDKMRGEEGRLMASEVPEQIGKMHINELMGRHPYHPFDPDLPRDHVCAELNATFYQCMSAMPEDLPLHNKHVNCYHPYKVDLMKCLTKQKRLERKKAEEEELGAK
eukprot:PhM_4_TR18620/c1_g1_i1/m.27189